MRYCDRFIHVRAYDPIDGRRTAAGGADYKS